MRFYEFMSQITDYDDTDLEKLCLYARALRPMLRDVVIEEDEIDLSNVELSHYRVAKKRTQQLKLTDNNGENQLKPTSDLGSAKPKDKNEMFLSEIIDKLNALFMTDQLTNADLVNYAYTIRDKVSENKTVMAQIANNSPAQAMLGDFSKAIDEAIMDSSAAHQNQMMQLLSDPQKSAAFTKVVFDLLVFSQGK